MSPSCTFERTQFVMNKWKGVSSLNVLLRNANLIWGCQTSSYQWITVHLGCFQISLNRPKRVKPRTCPTNVQLEVNTSMRLLISTWVSENCFSNSNQRWFDGWLWFSRFSNQLPSPADKVRKLFFFVIIFAILHSQSYFTSESRFCIVNVFVVGRHAFESLTKNSLEILLKTP